MKQEQFIRIRVKLMEQLRQGAEWSDEEILERIDLLVSETARENRLTVKQREEIRRELFYSVRKLDILQELLDDDRVTEIMVNGYQNIFVEREGKKSRWEKSFVSKEKLEDVVQQIAGKCNRVINENSPIVDARLENGSRVNAVIYPVALDGPILTIRRFPEHAITMEDLIAKESITREAATFLEQMVKAGYSILIGGGTSSGKTTFLNALSNAIPHEERIITIEDSAELQIVGIDNLVSLETRNANASGAGQITIRDLIKSSLRMRPERIVVGEVRGAEALDMLQAMNTGHDGSLSTGHANSTKDMLSRLETMVLQGAEGLPLEAVRQQIASAIDIIIHLSRLRDHSRKTMEITEVIGYENGEIILNPLYRFEEDENSTLEKVSGTLKRTENPLQNDFKLRLAGIYEDF